MTNCCGAAADIHIMNYFITGTDTGVGKTFFTTLLIRALRRAGLDTVGMKPVCCGDREDAELLRAAAGNTLDLDEVNPVWFSAPVAPYAAANIEKRAVDLAAIRARFTALRNAHRSLLVEGVGGWMVPIAPNYFVSDLAAEFGLPVLVVVRNRLGALNHSLLTIRAVQAAGLNCAGIVLNNADGPAADTATASNRAMIEELADAPILFEIERDQRELVLGIA